MTPKAGPQGSWNWWNPVHVCCGPLSRGPLDPFLNGGPVLMVTTPGAVQRGVAHRVKAMLDDRPVIVWDRVQPNPELADLIRAVEDLGTIAPEIVIGLGGGSALDSAKAIALGLRGGAQAIRDASAGSPVAIDVALPIVAIPTTAGTGSEVTPFATLWERTAGWKHSIAGPGLFPSLALLDVELTVSAKGSVTIAAGLDAISQALEAVWNRNASSLTTALATQSLCLSLPALPAVVTDPTNLAQRAAMLTASTLAGLAISHTRTALAHSISYPLTAGFGVPHGIACSFTLPALLSYNADADDGRLVALARSLGHRSIAALVTELDALLAHLGVAETLHGCGVTADALEGLRGSFLRSDRSDNNLRRASVSDAVSIALASLARL